jgi:hemerythrin-like domain-containing protein
MKRSAALIPLSHDHHQALFVAKLLRDAPDAEDRGEAARSAFLEFWRNDGEDHFRIEEAVLAPGAGLPAGLAEEGLIRMREEHVQIRDLAGSIGFDTEPEKLREIGQTLADHVRFEERELFPLIEDSLTPGQLDDLGKLVADEGRPDRS